MPPADPPPSLSVPLSYKNKTKSTGDSRRFLFFVVSCLLTNCFFPLPSIIIVLPWDAPLSRDTMTKKHALVGLVFKALPFISFLMSPRLIEDRAGNDSWA